MPRVVVGVRGEYVKAGRSTYVSPERVNRNRWSPNVTWYPSEFSKLRLQYNYDDRPGIGRDHSVWVQVEFLLGDPAKAQRELGWRHVTSFADLVKDMLRSDLEVVRRERDAMGRRGE